MSEEFAERLLAALHKKFPAEHGDAYITSTNLRLLILEALHPITVSQEFPRALYRGSSEFRTVENAQEEAKAIGEGWSRNAPAQFEPGYPRWFCERNTSEGGWKRFDLRRVQLNSPSEYEQWK